MLMEQLFFVVPLSQQELTDVFPNPWWPESRQRFSSHWMMKKSLDKLGAYHDAVDNMLLAFVRSLLADTTPLDPLENPDSAWSPEQRVLSNVGKNSISNWLDLSKTVWNSPAAVFLVWAACWMQNRQPHTGGHPPDEETTKLESSLALDTLFGILCAFLANEAESGLPRAKSGSSLREVAFRSPAFWNMSDSLGGDLSATRRAVAAELASLPKPGSDAGLPDVGVFLSVLRVCSMMFPERAARIDDDPVVESSRTRSSLNTALIQIESSLATLTSRRAHIAHIQELQTQLQFNLVSLVRRHAIATVSCYSARQVNHFIQFGKALVLCLTSWISDVDETSKRLFKLVPLDMSQSIHTIWSSLYPLYVGVLGCYLSLHLLILPDAIRILSVSFDSQTAGSAMLPESHQQFLELGSDICNLLCLLVADSRVFNPQERSNALMALILLMNQAELKTTPAMSSPKYIVLLGNALLVAFTKEQTSPAAAQFFLQFWEADEPLQLAFRTHLSHYLQTLVAGSDSAKLYTDFMTALTTRLNFNLTEFVRGLVDIEERRAAVLGSFSRAVARDNDIQALLDAANRTERHASSARELLNLSKIALAIGGIVFADRVINSMFANCILFLVDRLTSLSTSVDAVPSVRDAVQDIGNTVAAIFEMIPTQVTLADQFLSAAVRSQSFPVDRWTSFSAKYFTNLEASSRAYVLLAEIVEKCKNTLSSPSSSVASSTELEEEAELCPICCSEPVDTLFKPCGHSSCGVCIRRQLSVKATCFMCNQVVDSLEALT